MILHTIKWNIIPRITYCFTTLNFFFPLSKLSLVSKLKRSWSRTPLTSEQSLCFIICNLLQKTMCARLQLQTKLWQVKSVHKKYAQHTKFVLCIAHRNLSILWDFQLLNYLRSIFGSCKCRKLSNPQAPQSLLIAVWAPKLTEEAIFRYIPVAH